MVVRLAFSFLEIENDCIAMDFLEKKIVAGTQSYRLLFFNFVAKIFFSHFKDRNYSRKFFYS